ncbi:hypothetical protein [Streptomyces sp. NPDC057580]|uniref:hypothetical protein n=1 Tax=Streptomyces sp. NPDC057580 TaxID=3346173 RepID=UPI0036CDF160
MRLHEIRVADASRFEHRRHCKAEATGSVDSRREGRMEGHPPLVAAELRRQITVLELPAALAWADCAARWTRPRRGGGWVLRAVVSRRSSMRI